VLFLKQVDSMLSSVLKVTFCGSILSFIFMTISCCKLYYFCRIQSLETALKSCQKELKDEKAKLEELKEHFKYNLKLINDRDVELQRYDALFLGNN